MHRRVALVAVAALVSSLGVASASSLGSLSARTGAVAIAADDVRCTVSDATTDVTFHTGTLGILTEVPLADLGLLSLVTYVGLDGLSGACDGAQAVVVVVGNPAPGDPEQVLSRTLLGPLSGTGAAYRAVITADEINALIGLTATPTDVRIAFCPPGVTACGP